MAKVKITCARCKNEVEGLLTPHFTAGFYATWSYEDTRGKQEGAWHKYAQSEDEDYICDECMWADPEFRKDYPHVSV